MGSLILHVGTYTPKRILTNLDFEKILAASGETTSDQWITERTGMKERHVAEAYETVGSMAYEAVMDALSTSLSTLHPVEHIIVATNTHHRPFPNAAGEIHDRLRTAHPHLIDPNASGSDSYSGCTGINMALLYANSLIETGQFESILVVGSDKLSEVTDYSDKGTCILFGDGASAYLLAKNYFGNGGFRGNSLRGDGSRREAIYCEENAEKVTLYEALAAAKENRAPIKSRGRKIHMDGGAVFKYVELEWKYLIDGFKENRKLNPDGIDFAELFAISPHLANLRMFERLDRKHPGFLERCALASPQDIADFCNTSTASQGRRVKRFLEKSTEGDYLLCFGYGSGLHACANLYQRPRVT